MSLFSFTIATILNFPYTFNRNGPVCCKCYNPRLPHTPNPVKPNIPLCVLWPLCPTAYAYRDGGIDAIYPKRQTGRPKKLTELEEVQFRERILAGPKPQDAVCNLRGEDVRRIIESEFGVQYSLPGVYVLLHRLGLSSHRSETSLATSAHPGYNEANHPWQCCRNTVEPEMSLMSGE